LKAWTPTAEIGIGGIVVEPDPARRSFVGDVEANHITQGHELRPVELSQTA